MMYKYYKTHYVNILDDLEQYFAGLADSMTICPLVFSLLLLVLGSTHSFPFFTIMSLGLLTIALRRYIGGFALALQVIVAWSSMTNMIMSLLPVLDKLKEVLG